MSHALKHLKVLLPNLRQDDYNQGLILLQQTIAKSKRVLKIAAPPLLTDITTRYAGLLVNR